MAISYIIRNDKYGSYAALYLALYKKHFLFVPHIPKMLMRDYAREITKRSAAN